jgi:hypothetical protein
VVSGKIWENVFAEEIPQAVEFSNGREGCRKFREFPRQFVFSVLKPSKIGNLHQIVDFPNSFAKVSTHFWA